MRWNPLTRMKHAFGVAVDWRVRDVLEAERVATVELGQTFVRATAELMDRITLLERRLEQIEDKVADTRSSENQ